MLELELEPELEALLDQQAAISGETRAEFARRAILDRLEDREDYEIALRSLKEAQGEEPIPLQEVVKFLGMEAEFPPKGAEAAQKPARRRAKTHSGIPSRTASRIA